MTTKAVRWHVLLWITWASHIDGQILVFARNLNPLGARISVIVPTDATVHDLITAIGVESGIPEDVISSIKLNHAGTELSPPDTLADAGVGPETEVIFYLRRLEFTVMLYYFPQNASFIVRDERNISIPLGHADILEEIRQQVYEWASTRDLRPRISPDAPIGFVFLRMTCNRPFKVPPASKTHFFDYYIAAGHSGRFMENTAIMRDDVLLRQLRNESISRVQAQSIAESMNNAETRFGFIHDKASVLLSQLCSFRMSAVRIWTQQPVFRDAIFVHVEVPEGFDVLLKASCT